MEITYRSGSPPVETRVLLNQAPRTCQPPRTAFKPIVTVMPNLPATPEFIVTFAVFAMCASGVGGLAWLEKRPRDSLQPRLLPTTPLMLGVGFVGLLALVHLLNLAGVHTGR